MLPIMKVFIKKAGSMIRGITDGHLLGNGNKWTAVEVVEQLNVKTAWMARQSKLFGMLWIRGKWGLIPISRGSLMKVAAHVYSAFFPDDGGSALRSAERLEDRYSKKSPV